MTGVGSRGEESDMGEEESDEEETVTCKNLEDSAAVAITISAPPPSNGSAAIVSAWLKVYLYVYISIPFFSIF